MNCPTIPPATQTRLRQAAVVGHRHMQIVKIASALIAQGFNAEAVFWQLRPNYDSDVGDSEIRSVINWAFSRFGNQNDERVEKRPLKRKTPVLISGKTGVKNDAHPLNTPVNNGNLPLNTAKLPPFTAIAVNDTATPHVSETVKTNPTTAINRFLHGFTCEEADLWERSSVRLNADWKTDALTVIAALYRPQETINIVTRFALNAAKAHPSGYGISQTREKWLREIARRGAPQSAAGVWIRPNPIDENGVSDVNVTAYRFLLLEFDTVPLPLQTALYARLTLPIAAIITSGGKSLHAWVRVDAPNANTYRAIAKRIFNALAPFGVDTANRNPARLSRLPGVIREIGSASDKRQRLLYLNPEPKTERIIA